MFTFPAKDKSRICYEALSREGMLGTKRGVPFKWNVSCIQDASWKKVNVAKFVKLCK